MRFYLELAIVPPGCPIGEAQTHGYVVEAHSREYATCLVTDHARDIPGIPAGFTCCVEAGPGAPTSGVTILP